MLNKSLTGKGLNMGEQFGIKLLAYRLFSLKYDLDISADNNIPEWNI